VGDLVRIRGLASVRYLRFSQESNKDKNRRWWTCDPTKEQILFFLLICLRDHGVKGSKFGTTLQPEEIVEVLEGLDGTISCWYTAMECHIGGKADFHSVRSAFITNARSRELTLLHVGFLRSHSTRSSLRSSRPARRAYLSRPQRVRNSCFLLTQSAQLQRLLSDSSAT